MRYFLAPKSALTRQKDKTDFNDLSGTDLIENNCV
jgi:hypothetical protein